MCWCQNYCIFTFLIPFDQEARTLSQQLIICICTCTCVSNYQTCLENKNKSVLPLPIYDERNTTNIAALRMILVACARTGRNPSWSSPKDRRLLCGSFIWEYAYTWQIKTIVEDKLVAYYFGTCATPNTIHKFCSSIYIMPGFFFLVVG